MKTFDCGRTWQDVARLEPPEAPESSWGVPITMPSGRVFVFYVFNADDIRELPADTPPYPNGVTHRMDSHGHYVFRWSDDHGKTWSEERVVIPVREFDIDRNNPSGGKIRLFWNVGKPFLIGDSIFLPIHKVGGFGEGWFTSSEGALLRSDDLVTCKNPAKASWETLPDGERGIRTPTGGGPISEEHSFVTLSDGSLFVVFRTIDGHPGCAYSRDEGKSWEPSEYMCYADGRPMKHPRAATFVWNLGDGGYLYFFHNHGGKPLRDRGDRRSFAYTGRNPMWFCRGWEIDGPSGRRINWSQPEIGFYDDDPMVRISYPDFLEHGGKFLFTQTQKNLARIHTMPAALIDALSASPERRLAVLRETSPIFSWSAGSDPRTAPLAPLPVFVRRNMEPPYGGKRARSGFAIRLEIRMANVAPASLLESSDEGGSSLRVLLTESGRLRLELGDGQTAHFAESDPLIPGLAAQLCTINIDAASNTICFFRNGSIDDGGDLRQYGWSRFSPHYRNEFKDAILTLPESTQVSLDQLWIFDRVLMASEIEALDSRRITL